MEMFPVWRYSLSITFKRRSVFLLCHYFFDSVKTFSASLTITSCWNLKWKESKGRQAALCRAVKPVDLIFPRWTRTQSFCLSCNKRSINIPSGALRSGMAFVAHLPWCWGLVGNCGDGTTHTAPTRPASHLGPASDGGPQRHTASSLIMPLTWH